MTAVPTDSAEKPAVADAGVRSVTRVIDLLELFDAAHPTRSLKELVVHVRHVDDQRDAAVVPDPERAGDLVPFPLPARHPGQMRTRSPPPSAVPCPRSAPLGHRRQDLRKIPADRGIGATGSLPAEGAQLSTHTGGPGSRRRSSPRSGRSPPPGPAPALRRPRSPAGPCTPHGPGGQSPERPARTCDHSAPASRQGRDGHSR